MAPDIWFVIPLVATNLTGHAKHMLYNVQQDAHQLQRPPGTTSVCVYLVTSHFVAFLLDSANLPGSLLVLLLRPCTCAKVIIADLC